MMTVFGKLCIKTGLSFVILVMAMPEDGCEKESKVFQLRSLAAEFYLFLTWLIFGLCFVIVVTVIQI